MTPSKTAKLTGSAPVLFVRDVYAATKHYRNAMGFSFGDIFGELRTRHRSCLNDAR
jgi:hypothetical protein